MTTFFASLLTVLSFTLAAADANSARKILNASSPHEALGLAPGATAEEVKAAHRTLAKKYFQQSNLGDAEATKVMQTINDARDRLSNKEPIQGSARTGAWGGDGPRGERGDTWSSFHARMAEAKTAAERMTLREGQLKHVREASEFASVAQMFPQSAQGAAESVEFAVKNMKAFIAARPTITDLNSLAATGISPEGQQAVYRAALAQSSSPGQMLDMIKPNLGAMGGGMGWIKNLEAAMRTELPRFFAMNPTELEQQRMLATLRLTNRGDGERLFYDAAKRAGVGAKVAPRSSGPNRGLMDRIMGKIARKFFAVDPSLVTGVATELVAGQEAEALDNLACPSSFAKTGGRILSPEYTRLLAMSGKDAQDLTVMDCAQASPELGARMTERLDGHRRDALAKLTQPGARARCRVGQGGPGIELTLPNGLRAEIAYGASGDPKSVELTAQPGAANPNNFVRLDFGGPRDLEFSYSAFGPKQPTPRDKLPIIRESEASFFARVTCASERCDRRAFLEKTVHWDTNVFSVPNRGEPDEHAPFGDLDKGYLVDTAKSYVKIMTILRALPTGGRGFTEACRAFGGEPPAVAAAPGGAAHDSPAPTAGPATGSSR